MEIIIKILKIIYKKNLCCIFYRWKGDNILSCQSTKGSQRAIIKSIDDKSIKEDVIKTILNVANENGYRWDQSNSGEDDGNK